MRRGAARDIAIVGMGCRFPGAPDLFAFWANILANRDVLREVPADRWPVATFHDPAPDANDRVSCRRGGYLESPIPFDPAAHGIMPLAVAGGEPEQFLVLDTARAALADAGMDPDRVGRLRVEVVVGRGNYFNRGNLTRLQHGRIVAQTVGLLAALHPEWTEEDLEALRRDLKASLPPFEAATIPGQLTNATAEARGPAGPEGASFVVDAASASSLVALDLGRRALIERRADLALVGGVYLEADVDFPLVFQQLAGALALRRVTAVLGRRGRDGPGRGRRRRGPQAAARRGAGRRPDLRRAQGSRAGQRRPRARAHLAERAGDMPARFAGPTATRGSNRGASRSSKATGSECRPPIAPSCGPCVRSSRPTGARLGCSAPSRRRSATPCRRRAWRD